MTEQTEPLHNEPVADRRAREPSETGRPSTMGTTTRNAVGVLAFLPLVLTVGILSVMAATPPGTDETQVGLLPYANAVLYGGLLLLGMVVLFFGAFVMNDRHLRPNSKLLWAASFLLAGPVTVPVYWYMHVRNAPRHNITP